VRLHLVDVSKLFRSKNAAQVSVKCRSDSRDRVKTSMVVDMFLDVCTVVQCASAVHYARDLFQKEKFNEVCCV
jgi:hypothetical protein